MNTDNLICIKCKSKTFEIHETKTGNMDIICTSCGGIISPLHPGMSIEEFVQFWKLGQKI